MHADHLKERFHHALHKGAEKKGSLGELSEKELEEVTVVLLAVVAEALGEVAVVVADLATRVEQIEAQKAAS